MSELTSWIPSLTTTAALAGALWLGRNIFVTRLTNTVKHEFDVKIAKVKADIESKASDIEALRGGALATASSKNAAIYSKRLEAVEIVWAGVVQLEAGKALAETMSVFDYDLLLDQSKENGKLANFTNQMAETVDEELLSTRNVSKVRPFLSPLSWALFTAYKITILQYHTMLLSLKLGEGEDFVDFKAVKDLLISALPDQETAIEKTVPKKYYIFLDVLEERLLSELQNTISGVENSENSIMEARNILSSVEEIVQPKAKNA